MLASNLRLRTTQMADKLKEDFSPCDPPIPTTAFEEKLEAVIVEIKHELDDKYGRGKTWDLVADEGAASHEGNGDSDGDSDVDDDGDGGDSDAYVAGDNGGGDSYGVANYDYIIILFWIEFLYDEDDRNIHAGDNDCNGRPY